MGIEAVFPLPASGPPAASHSVPLLSGDRLNRAEFERRYMAHPELKKAELIEGVVYVASPVRFEQHARPHYTLIAWLGMYQAATPGVVGADNATVRLDFENEVQPDALLRLPPELGGRSRVAPDDYLEGPPELIVEVAASSAAYDLHDKRRAYARNGVQEYLALQIYEQRVDWFALREGVYALLAPDAQGLLRSEAFPGLWLDQAAFWRADLAALLAVLQRGLATPEHAAFADRLRGAGTE
jgi:Uma2 family endonuclease